MQTAPKIGFVSLGCPKALVDSERILTHLRAEGYDISASYAGSDVVIVNTCGFLDSARSESLDAIQEAMKENGRVIVTGCLGRDPELIRSHQADVLDITGPHDYAAVIKAVHNAVPPIHDPYMDLVPPEGLRLTPRHYAYLKISEGCNHRCRFCIIPHLRGDLASRPVDQVLREAEKLVAAGVKELLVISQDTSAYGLDLKYSEAVWRGQSYAARLTDLCDGLGSLGVWVRLHYVYPYPHVDEIIPHMTDGRILPYLDIPFQHASPSILKAMRRPAHQVQTLDRIRAWREQVPDLVLRSTFIVGFPGETEADFQMLLDWLDTAQLDHVGCFCYEPVTGAAANDDPGTVPEDVKQDRYDRLMTHQQAISQSRLTQRIGRTIEVLIDSVEPDRAIGRSWGDAPEIDGSIILEGSDAAPDLQPGQMVRATVTDCDAYDLWADIEDILSES